VALVKKSEQACYSFILRSTGAIASARLNHALCWILSTYIINWRGTNFCLSIKPILNPRRPVARF